MKKEFYYVYCKGLLGVKTNVNDFKWIYGSIAPLTSLEEYNKCLVKFDIQVKHEKDLTEKNNCDIKFQAFEWDAERSTLSYRRAFPLKFKLGYNVKINGNTVYAEIGELYYKAVKNRVMNLHGMYYLLSDIANILLLKNGFLTLYASAVHFGINDKSVVSFAAPSTGKTLTAVKLCESKHNVLVGEDILITDGIKIYACPWTNSYRKNKNSLDSAGAFSRGGSPADTNIINSSNLTDVAILSLGNEKICEDKELILKQMTILNGYLFNYYSSPIIKVLAYFDSEYDKNWNMIAETLMRGIINTKSCYYIRTKKSEDFANIIEEKIFGNDK